MFRRPPYERILTRSAAVRRLSILVSFLASTQFVLTGFTILLPRPAMGFVWLAAAGAIAWGTFIFESHKWRRVRESS